MKKVIFSLILVLCSSQALSAWDGVNSGLIKKIDVAPNDPRTIRVFLTDANGVTPKMCGNDYTWAYLHENDVGYTTVVSALLSAKATNSSIAVYANKNPADNNYCKIGYISF